MRGPILGLGGSNHDFSAAIVREGSIVVAIEDERIQRVKNARTEWHAHPARDAASYCLEAAGLGLDDLAGIYCCDDLARLTSWIDWSRVTFVNHHTAHAAASFFASPHRRATLLVVDGHGAPLGEGEESWEVETISVGWAEGTSLSITPLQTGAQKKTSSPWRYGTEHSIGWFYEIVTMAIGFGDSGHGKTMGLAAYGTPAVLDELRALVAIGSDGSFHFDPYAGISDWLTDTMRAAETPYRCGPTSPGQRRRSSSTRSSRRPRRRIAEPLRPCSASVAVAR